MAAARLTVDLDALAANFAVLRARATSAEIAPVVKADAYGLGAAAVARRLWAEGARTFYVARLEEGERLRGELGSSRPATVLVFDGPSEGEVERFSAAGLTPVLNSPEQIALWSAGGRRPTALHVDTGMNRLGLRVDEAAALAGDPARLGAFDLRFVLSHLACGGDRGHPMSERQRAAFAEVLTLFPGVPASLANTAGVFLGPPYHHAQVRPGVGLYGGGPWETPHPELRTVATLTAPVLQVRDLPAGETIGYGASFTAERPMRVAVLAAGFADGVLRSFGPRGYAWLEGARRPYLGRISMDLIALDVTGSDVRPGAVAQLLGPQVLLDDVATAAGTVPYEVLGRAAGRAERVYVGAHG